MVDTKNTADLCINMLFWTHFSPESKTTQRFLRKITYQLLKIKHIQTKMHNEYFCKILGIVAV